MKKLLLPLLAILLFTACQKQISIDKAQEEIVAAAANRPSPKITVCHRDASTGPYKTISISSNAWPAHQAHGDVRLDDQDGDGYVPNNACGYGKMGDCKDLNAAIHPGATEICGNNIDENCNGQIDENCIASVTICNQVWMLKNLDVSKYRNGDDIPQVTDPSAWAALTTGAWCWYLNNSANGATYGKLYNGYAVNDPRGLAPAGWHVPTDAEWTELSSCLDAISPTGNVGGKMKETGTTHWTSPNTGATNSSGFTGLPGGLREGFGPFSSIGDDGVWWSTAENGMGSARYRFLLYNSGFLGRDSEDELGRDGFSVRCIRD